MKPYWVIFAMLLSTHAFAQDFSFKSTKSSPFKAIDTIEGVTRFSGRAILKGRFIASLEDSEGQYPHSISLSFIPDSAAQATLPYIAFYGPVEEIRIANEEKALMALVPPAQLKALNAGRTRQVAGDSQIMVSSYAASVDCDTPEYSAFFLSVVVPPDKVVAIRSVGTETGC